MGPTEFFGLLGVPALTYWVSTQLGEAQSALFVSNLALQCAGFLAVALIPCYFTRKMMWVDVAWPWGLFAIGVQLYVHGTGEWYRKTMISSSFVLCGLRMGLGEEEDDSLLFSLLAILREIASVIRCAGDGPTEEVRLSTVPLRQGTLGV